MEPDRSPEPELLRRAINEYEAARRRVERDAARVQEETRSRLVADLLPVLDNLDRAIEAHPDRGVQQVRDQMAGVLHGYGLERFDATGERFDPEQHEAMAVVDVDEPDLDGSVVEQWQAGYRIANHLLRPARVTVGRYRPQPS
jgi:molecular chaperone GrpE